MTPGKVLSPRTIEATILFLPLLIPTPLLDSEVANFL